MEIFIDTAEISQIKKYWNMGVIDGVTTNPTLIAKCGRDFKQVVAEIAEIVKGPISVEAVSTQASDLWCVRRRSRRTHHKNNFRIDTY